MPLSIRIWKEGDPPMTSGGWTGRLISPGDPKPRASKVTERPNAEPRGGASESDKSSVQPDGDSGA